jgi:predicted transcriptional regulator
MNTRKKIERKETVSLRVSESEKREIDNLARETRLGTSALMRQCFVLGKRQLVQAGIVSGSAK